MRKIFGIPVFVSFYSKKKKKKLFIKYFGKKLCQNFGKEEYPPLG